jgi:general secretion pathway protein K
MKRQRGVALITAVLIVALASIAAAAMLSSANLAIHRASTLSDTERAWWYADGIEAWVKSILQLDAEQGKKDLDYLGEAWAKPVDYLPVDEGALRGGIVDLQGRFNLNSLVLGGDPRGPRGPDGQPVLKFKPLFQRLLQNIEALRDVPTDGLAEAIHDWIDEGDDPLGFSGAEDSEYSSLQPPYRAANRLMTSVSELLAIKGVNKQIYLALRDHVCVLPRANTKINVNTATPPLLLALSPTASPALTEFLESRVDQPATDVGNFWRDVAQGAGPLPDYLDVKTEYFRLHGQAFIGSSHLALYSVVHRPGANGLPAVISRSQDVD